MRRLIPFLLIQSVSMAMPVAPTNYTDQGCSNIHKVDLLRPQSALSELGFTLDALSAEPILKMYNEQTKKQEDQCGSIVTSDDGMILTAAHCVTGCLERMEAFKAENDQLVIDQNKMPITGCLLGIGDKLFPYDIVAVSDCPPESALKMSNPAGKCQGLEYAVLKFRGTSDVPSKCAKIGFGAIGTKGFVIGRGEESIRQFDDAKDSQGDVRVSKGEIIQPQNFCVERHFGLATGYSEKKIPLYPYFAKVVQKEVKNGVLFQTSVDTLSGFSGTGLLDADGAVVGILSLGDPQSNNAGECVGASFFVNIQSILKDISQKFPSVAEHMFRCEKNAIHK